MTSHELAKKLLEMPDCEVTVWGYRGGVDIVESIQEPRELALNIHEEGYYGKHEYTDYEKFEDNKKIQAIHIS